jgi:biopolymer transport protein ExbD
MHFIHRLLPLLLLTFVTASGLRAAQPPTAEADYKRSDTNFYLRSDVLKAFPSAVVLPMGSYTQKDDTYVITPKKKAPKVVYVEVSNDWIEPVTPPDAPPALAMAPDAMQVREPQGDVEVAMPSAPAAFAPATDGMAIPNGAVVKTGADGTAAVLFGGVDSARLIPNSEAAVQQTVMPQTRSTEIDLTIGAVFSKVGKQEGVTQDYKVHTPFGVASARGTDFVTVAMPRRTDVWIAQGTVELDQTGGEKVGVVSSEGTGSLKIMRFPVMAGAHDTMMANAETMTAAMDFIPLADRKIKALRDKMAAGTALTPGEQSYLARIKQVPCVIKLALIEPIAPPPPPPRPGPAPVPSPVPTETAPEPVPTPAPSIPPTPSTSTMPLTAKPVIVRVRMDGKVDYKRVTLTLDALKTKLQSVSKTTPDQPFKLTLGKKATAPQYQHVATLFDDAGLKNVTKDESLLVSLFPVPTPPSPANPTPTPVPAPLAPLPPSTSTAASAPAPSPVAETPAPSPPKVRARPHDNPINTVFVRPDGTVKFRGSTMEIEKLAARLQSAIQEKPDLQFYINAVTDVPYEKLQAVLDTFKSANLQVTSLDIHAPDSPPVVHSKPHTADPDLPAPMMHPAMETESNDTPSTPTVSPPNPTPAEPPTTNSAPSNPSAP